MRISDWSSDVCSADLVREGERARRHAALLRGLSQGEQGLHGVGNYHYRVVHPSLHHLSPSAVFAQMGMRKIRLSMTTAALPSRSLDRKSAVQGQRVSVRVDLGGGRNIKKQKKS